MPFLYIFSHEHLVRNRIGTQYDKNTINYEVNLRSAVDNDELKQKEKMWNNIPFVAKDVLNPTYLPPCPKLDAYSSLTKRNNSTLKERHNLSLRDGRLNYPLYENQLKYKNINKIRHMMILKEREIGMLNWELDLRPSFNTEKFPRKITKSVQQDEK